MTRSEVKSTPAQLRRIAASLLTISDELEAESLGGQVLHENEFGKAANELFFARQDSMLEAIHATYRERRRRKKFFPAEFFGEPAWDILLDLFISRLEGRRISVTSACIGSDVPSTTALRWLGHLEGSGFVDRKVSDKDQRVTWVQLSDFGAKSMEEFFQTQRTLSDRRNSEDPDHFLLAKGVR